VKQAFDAAFLAGNANDFREIPSDDFFNPQSFSPLESLQNALMTAALTVRQAVPTPGVFARSASEAGAAKS
jgi:hypothetical protein